MRISKSKFLAGVRCLKRLYLLVHEPGLAAQPDGATKLLSSRDVKLGCLPDSFFRMASKCNTALGSVDYFPYSDSPKANSALPAGITMYCFSSSS